jgi:1-acyl-sn-glycerol-3-phosphate acyltransferase
MSAFHVPLRFRINRWFIQKGLKLLFHCLGRVSISGKENIPADGPYFIVFNHVSLFDPPFVLAEWPVAPEALGAVEIWSRPGQNVLATVYGGIPIHRGEVDREAMGRCLAALRGGRPLALAPEGSRSHQPGMQAGKPGLVYLLDKTGAIIVPVGVTGTVDNFLTRALHWERPPLRMEIGKPFHVPPGLDDLPLPPREIRQKKVDYVMEQIAALLPESYRGVYR